MEVEGVGLVPKERMEFTNVEMRGEGGVGLDISSAGHGMNGHTEVTGVGCSPGLAEVRDVNGDRGS